MQYEIQNQTKDSPVMKITNFADVAEKIIATIVFVLLVTVLSIKDYPTTSTQSHQDKPQVTASIVHHSAAHNAPVVD